MYLCLRSLFACIRLGLHAYAYRDHDVQQALLQEHQSKLSCPFSSFSKCRVGLAYAREFASEFYRSTTSNSVSFNGYANITLVTSKKNRAYQTCYQQLISHLLRHIKQFIRTWKYNWKYSLELFFVT